MAINENTSALRVGEFVGNASRISPLDALQQGLDRGQSQTVTQGSAALDTILNQANSGALGSVAQTLQQFSGISTMAGLGFGGPAGIKIAATASAATNLVGIGSQFQQLLGGGGIGLDAASALTGINAGAGILGSVAGVGQAFGANLGGLGQIAGLAGLGAGAAGSLLGLFGGGGGGCPCAPSCRKTEHGQTPDGTNAVVAAGSVLASGANAYAPEGNPLQNNIGCAAATMGVFPTTLGAPLIAGNPNDLTMLINTIGRVGMMSQQFSQTGNADWRHFHSELSYTFNAIQNALKQTDNNLTKTESIARKAIDIATRLLSEFWCVLAGKEKPTFDIKDFPIFLPLVIYIATQSKAIIDLQAQVTSLNSVKDGGRVPPKLDNVLKVAAQLAPLFGLIGVSCDKANTLYDEFIDPMDTEWRDMTPIPNLEDIVIGGRNPDLPTPHQDIETYIDENKITTDDINSKLGGNVTERNPLFNLVPNPDDPEISSLLDQIRFNQDKANRGEGDC
jgi:hypothetical protein